MSDLAYYIATEHKLRFHEPSLTTTCSLPTCGVEPRLVYDESSLGTVQAHHVAQVTEAAVREQIAAEIEAAAERRSWIADSALIQGMREAAEIARGES